jgi:hypothetical protein
MADRPRKAKSLPDDIQKMYVRVCRDSGFRMETARAAHFTAQLLDVSALDVWFALGLDNMERIAGGTRGIIRVLVTEE